MIASNAPYVADLPDGVYPVSEEWFWDSIRIQARVGESSYRPKDLEQNAADKTPNKSLNSIERSPSSILNELGINSPQSNSQHTPEPTSSARKRRKNADETDTLSDQVSFEDGTSLSTSNKRFYSLYFC